MLFKEEEMISKKETNEVEERLYAYLQGNKYEFVSLEDVLDPGHKSIKSLERA